MANIILSLLFFGIGLSISAFCGRAWRIAATDCRVFPDDPIFRAFKRCFCALTICGICLTFWALVLLFYFIVLEYRT